MNSINRIFVIGKKTTAVSFIVLIIVANYWLIQKFTGQESAAWSLNLFILATVFVGIGFLMMVPEWVNPKKVLQDPSEFLENEPKDD